MTKRERTIQLQRRAIAATAVVLTTATIFAVSVTNKVTALDKSSYIKQTARIEVEKGETLWSIAENNCPEDVEIRSYIREVIRMNHLNEEGFIVEGMYLFIPKYASVSTITEAEPIP